MIDTEIYPLAKELWDLCQDIPCGGMRSYVWYRDVRAVIEKINRVAES
jgi:hypothetical protein